MAPTRVDPDAVRAFADAAAFARWLRANHARASELWVKFAKAGSGIASVTYPQALDEALCWGWIDGQKKSFDDHYWLQRFSPRGPRSIWSKINREHAERLIREGRMQPPGQAEIDRAKADGRWARAYDGAGRMEFPADLLAAIEADPKALETFTTLNAQNRYALAFRTHNMKTPAGRARKIAGFVDMLRRGETIYPNGRRR
ncbi:MAG TPA: YdeI/OmpD-associated family protein [Hypericibacter adhaerens]|uniref:YdeI/OmpD-associated family protein n=1 Tax=Hypericibacter adhaerens TaxID=2602016 RepID=UPI002BFFECC4|nr:YdeI/OmpD-associated family protein [Hypericibacter adhaerens]HWA42377.1 YdeI/OmpD-associated family protein [Hypericibacter adhaerens]